MEYKKCKHSRLKRYTTYESGDCYCYHIKCLECDLRINEWTEKEAENKLTVNLKSK